MASNILATYSPEDIIVTIAGLLPLSGFAEGTFINISREKELFSYRESADGVVSRTISPSKVYKVEVTLVSSSKSNEVLTKIALLDSKVGVLKFPLYIKDNMGSSLLFSTSSWIQNISDAEFSTTLSSRKWTIICADATNYVGGNEDASGALEDLANTVLGLSPTLGGLI